MSDIEDLVAELRDWDAVDSLRRAADVLEQTVKERDVLAQGQMNAHDFCNSGDAMRQMYNRAKRAERERDALADRIERAQEPLRDVRLSDSARVRRIARILSEGESE